MTLFSDVCATFAAASPYMLKPKHKTRPLRVNPIPVPTITICIIRSPLQMVLVVHHTNVWNKVGESNKGGKLHAQAMDGGPKHGP